MSRKPNRKSTASARARSDNSNQLRIIGGQWRSRKLAFPSVDGLRPTGDRIRETLFNWLNFSLPGARCLDLFAGSGALALEALSRGAGHTVMIERHPAAARQLRVNCTSLQADAEVIEADTLQWLQDRATEAFDLVFLDPPFDAELQEPVSQQLEAGGWLTDNAHIYIESPSSQSIAIPDNWQLLKEKIAGQVAYRLYQRQASNNQ